MITSITSDCSECNHLAASPGFSRFRVTQFLALFVCFVDRCLSFCTFSFGHCVVRSSLMYGFWLPLWYLHTLLPQGIIFFLFAYENKNCLSTPLKTKKTNHSMTKTFNFQQENTTKWKTNNNKYHSVLTVLRFF